MKKVLVILLCAVMALSLVACGTQKTEMQDTNSGTVSELEENNKTVSDDNPLIGTWVCQTNESLIYTFVNDMDLEIFDAGETFMYAYECDGEWLTITDGDMSRSTRIGISEDGFTLYGDEILAFKNINDSNSESDAEKDKRSWISGIWVSGPNEDTERGGLAKSFYIFNTDGTWNWVYILDSIENGKMYSVEDNFEKWFSKSNSVKRQTYTYDGETLLFTPSDDFRDRVELLLDNNSFTLEFDFGKYVVEGHQNGSETYTLYRKF